MTEAKHENDMGDVFSFWMKASEDILSQATSFFTLPGTEADEKDSGKKFGKKTRKMVESGTKIFSAMMEWLAKPENLNAVLKGSEVVPDLSIAVLRQLSSGFLELQKKWIEMSSKFGEHTEKYSLTEMDEEMFKTWRDVYEKEFQKIFNIPQLGLHRFHQERVLNFLDRSNIYQTSVAEFLYMFYIPIEQSFTSMQEETDRMLREETMPSDFKEYYNIWIKILEGHYMRLLKSPEYTSALNNLITELLKYRKARDEVLYDLLEQLPIPTNKEMDELYSDYHELKKKVRELSKKVEMLETGSGE